MGKYGESVGRWMLNVGGFDKELTPKKGDARRILDIFTKAEENGKEWLFNQFQQFMYDLISRDYPPLNEEEKTELNMFIEFNAMKLLEETQIAFRFAKREDLEKLKKGLLQTPVMEQTKGNQSIKQRSQGIENLR